MWRKAEQSETWTCRWGLGGRNFTLSVCLLDASLMNHEFIDGGDVGHTEEVKMEEVCVCVQEDRSV